MTPDRLLAWVMEAQTAPSVHNVQPARWRVEPGAILLAEDMNRRLAIGDATGHDAAISLGAAAEGLRLAALASGYALLETREALPPLPDGLRPVMRFSPVPTTDSDALAPLLACRASWRGAFASPDEADRRALQALTATDCTVITNSPELRRLGRCFDRASYGFMRQAPFRRELRNWMRLSPRDPRWSRDGLNAQAMALSSLEALGAGFVLGPAFALLDRFGLAAPLLAEGSKIAGAAGLLLFHRPTGEDPFDSGRHFHRLWLAIEGVGMGAAVLAALADDRNVAADLMTEQGVPAGRRLVSAFRAGRRSGKAYPRARLPIGDVLI
ncbi:hypothetical protein [Sphingobium sp. WCS2017Hpa-17]|uniref:hypothetical protein n=1 Tax=Sphingobium sp. WCS2017Hpa-17 TaxID=3073638 RepID=UPI00288A86AD|nr:hypothetical protein [Sphingobium sp. WCS2017Hpa-17]